MPRSGGGIYSKPAGTTAVPNTVIESSKYNSTIDDIVTDLNAARPISAGGTGSTTAADARTALGISATNTPFTPTGAIAATNVQTALAELDTEKATASLYAPLAGATFTGAIAGTTATFSGIGSFTGVVSGGNATADGHLLNRITADARYLGDTYRNRIINPAMQISQERGTTLVDVTTGTAYTVDQVRAVLSTTPGGTLRAQQTAGFTPAGSPFFTRFTAQAADASLAAGDYYGFDLPQEGQMVADAQFGTASARALVARFSFRSSIAGTFHVFVQNSARNRSRVFPFTIAGGEINTWVSRSFAIPGDTSGTWLTDTGIGINIGVTLSSGTTFNGTAGSWAGSDVRSVSGATSFMASGGATFDVADVGLYVDHLNIGAAPSWELPAWDADLRACHRYFRTLIVYSLRGGTPSSGVNCGGRVQFSPMRTTPIIQNIADGSLGAIGARTFTAVTNDAAQVTADSTSGAGFIIDTSFSVNARF